ncbi:hypothetical protein DCCM_3624 [Desulfocucumis palustris]|uniref:Uncharacterized protein n=1 Tax=Desulfocucumis palustris TaxID=1898651 RepID=A0A2L2XJR0_9FIRM|nr:hypothetical protein DCCM_3624 [Desulfocucumis palustris]
MPGFMNASALLEIQGRMSRNRNNMETIKGDPEISFNCFL